jgi:hypothetical protein
MTPPNTGDRAPAPASAAATRVRADFGSTFNGIPSKVDGWRNPQEKYVDGGAAVN